MRVLFATPFYYPDHQFGGPPRKIHSIATALSSSGNSVLVATFDSMAPHCDDRKEVDDVTIQYLPWIGRGLRQWPRRIDLLSRLVGQSDIVQCYGLYNFICPVVVRLAHRHGKPVVLEPLGMYPPRARNQVAKRIYNLAITKWMVCRASAVIAASRAEAAELQEIVKENKIIYRRNGINISTFMNLPSGNALRKEWRVLAHEKVVLYIGRISPIKNLEQLILAFQAASLAQTQLILVGPLTEPAYETKLRTLIKSHQLEDRVKIAGPLYEEDQRAALASADLFVLPSISESFGNAAAEAVAAGIPVLLSETCGIAPTIHRRAGLAVPLGMEPIAEGMRIMLDPAGREPLLSEREQVKRELSWEEPIKQTERLYRKILEEQLEVQRSRKNAGD